MYGVTPDISTWGKALGNGFAVSALAGKRELMEPGGLNTDVSRVFLLSTTHGAEATGLAAYLAVSKAYAERDVVAEMESQGTKLRSGLEQVAKEAGMSEHVAFRGTALMSGVCDQGPQRPALSGFPHSLHAGVAASRSARTITGYLRRPHRHRH